VITVAYIDGNSAMREYGSHYLGYYAGYLVEAFDSLKYGSDWFVFHTYDAIVLQETGNPDLIPGLLSMLPYGDTTPVIVLRKSSFSHKHPDMLPFIASHEPVFALPSRDDPHNLFFELHLMIELAVCRTKLQRGMQSLDSLLKRSGLSAGGTINERIGDIVGACGRCLSAVFAAYHRAPEKVLCPAAEWHAGECNLRYAPADYAVLPILSRRIRRGMISSGWTCLEDGRIAWAGNDGTLSVFLYPVLGEDDQKGTLSIVYPSADTPAIHELLMVETCADLISWHERLAVHPAGEMNA